MKKGVPNERMSGGSGASRRFLSKKKVRARDADRSRKILQDLYCDPESPSSTTANDPVPTRSRRSGSAPSPHISSASKGLQESGSSRAKNQTNDARTSSPLTTIQPERVTCASPRSTLHKFSAQTNTNNRRPTPTPRTSKKEVQEAKRAESDSESDNEDFLSSTGSIFSPIGGPNMIKSPSPSLFSPSFYQSSDIGSLLFPTLSTPATPITPMSSLVSNTSPSSTPVSYQPLRDMIYGTTPTLAAAPSKKSLTGDDHKGVNESSPVPPPPPLSGSCEGSDWSPESSSSPSASASHQLPSDGSKISRSPSKTDPASPSRPKTHNTSPPGTTTASMSLGVGPGGVPIPGGLSTGPHTPTRTGLRSPARSPKSLTSPKSHMSRTAVNVQPSNANGSPDTKANASYVNTFTSPWSQVPTFPSLTASDTAPVVNQALFTEFPDLSFANASLGASGSSGFKTKAGKIAYENLPSAATPAANSTSLFSWVEEESEKGRKSGLFTGTGASALHRTTPFASPSTGDVTSGIMGLSLLTTPKDKIIVQVKERALTEVEFVHQSYECIAPHLHALIANVPLHEVWKSVPANITRRYPGKHDPNGTPSTSMMPMYMQSTLAGCNMTAAVSDMHIESRSILHSLHLSLGSTMSTCPSPLTFSSPGYDYDDESDDDLDCPNIIADEANTQKRLDLLLRDKNKINKTWFDNYVKKYYSNASVHMKTRQAQCLQCYHSSLEESVNGTFERDSEQEESEQEGCEPETKWTRCFNHIDMMLPWVCSRAFIAHIVQELPYEDERFDSPRVSVLESLYLKFPSTRPIIIYFLSLVSKSRVKRCVNTNDYGVRLELNINEVASRGLLDISPRYNDKNGTGGVFQKSNSFAAAHECSNLAAQDSHVEDAIIRGCVATRSSVGDGSEEKSAITILDSDHSVLELMKFIIKYEQLNYRYQVELGISEDQPGYRWDLYIEIIVNCLRCYGSRLSRKGEATEQPFQLTNIIKLLQQLLTDAPTFLRDGYNAMLDASRCDKKAHGDGAHGAYILLAKLLYRSWPNGNYIRELAYLKVAEMLFAVIPNPLVEATLAKMGPAELYSDELKAVVEDKVDGGTAEGLSTNLLPNLLTRDGSSFFHPLQFLVKCMSKMISMISSVHFKIANQAIISLLHNGDILYRWFIRKDHYGDEEVEVNETPLVGDLVDILRNNRRHWHPNIQIASSTVLDMLLELLYS